MLIPAQALQVLPAPAKPRLNSKHSFYQLTMKLPKPMSLKEIAAIIGGQLHGPNDLIVENIATSPFEACESDLAFAFDKKLLKEIENCKAKALIVPVGFKLDRPFIAVERPNLAIYKVLSVLQPKRYYPALGIHATAVVDSSAEIHPEAAIGPYVVIGAKTKIGARTKIMAGTVIGGEVTIGQDCLFYPNCNVSDYVKIGNRVILQQGASLGADGFGYVTEKLSNMERRMAGMKELSLESNPMLKIPQIGTVIIEDDVEIGSNTTIDRATIGATTIGRGTKIDNQVMIAHNCKIGEEAIIIAQVAIAGSCSIGERVILAGQAGIKDHITIGRDAIIEGQAGVMRDVEPEDIQVGAPARPVRDFMSQVAAAKKLPKLLDEFRALSKRVYELEAQLAENSAGGVCVGSPNS